MVSLEYSKPKKARKPISRLNGQQIGFDRAKVGIYDMLGKPRVRNLPKKSEFINQIKKHAKAKIDTFLSE